MQVAEAIVRILEKEGIGDAFGIPGAGINGVYKYLADSPIKHHIMRHEEAVVHAADGYFRSSGRMALAICTSGPGATNFITGLYTANIDSMPLFAITGQAVRAQLGMDAFQCVDIVSIASPIVKKAVCITEPEKIGEIMQDLFWTAREGRMGPVLLDVPLDVQTAEIDFDINSYQSKPIIQKSPDEEKIKKTIELLDAAEKPVIIMGGGVILAHAEKLLVSFAELMNIPVITTYMAKGGIPENHPLNAGQAGIQVGALPSYLNQLREVGVVDKLVPLGESEKRGVWRICDLFFRFHSFFVTRNISTIVSGRMPQAYDKVVAPLLNDYMGKVFEEIVRQYIERHADLPFPLGIVGTWWGGSRTLHKEIEIDVVAKSAISNEAIIGSVKFRERMIDSKELELMRSYSREMGGAENFLYWFFSKSGFADDIKKLAENNENIRLFTIEDIYGSGVIF